MDEKKYIDWCKLISVRAKIEVALLESVDLFFTDDQRAIVNEFLMTKNTDWVKFIFNTLTEKANKGYEELRPTAEEPPQLGIIKDGIRLSKQKDRR